jgi:List-Bact-rpt repeat protein
LMTVISEKGIATGGGYYDEGKTATVSVTPTTAGNFLVPSSFKSWTGDLQTSSQTATIVMDSPKTIKAMWADSYLIVYALVGAAGAGVAVAYLKVIKPKMVAKEKARAPDLDWYKS